MEMNLPVIKLETRNLTKKFSATEGVADISLQVYEHELLTLLGPSGCGKTTILRAIGGFNKIDSGKILLDGAEVQGLPPEKRPAGPLRFYQSPHPRKLSDPLLQGGPYLPALHLWPWLGRVFPQTQKRLQIR